MDKGENQFMADFLLFLMGIGIFCMSHMHMVLFTKERN